MAGTLTAVLTSPYHTPETNYWGFTMRGIQPAGQCPTCRVHYKSQKSGFVCPECKGRPQQYRITISFKGETIRRSTTFDGKPLRTPADAYALKRQAENEIDSRRFDPEKWRSKTKIDFTFRHQVLAWYYEKVEEMNRGKLAPSYVPKLNTYIKHYFLPFFEVTDVREILSVKDFANQLPERLSIKYQKNLLIALHNFFKWLKVEARLIPDVPYFKTFEVPEHVPTVITPETQAALLELIPAEHKPIFTFLFNQGVRPSEARALKWKDIEGDTVTIRRTWSGEALREQTKTKRIRYNYLFPETLAALPGRSFDDAFVFTHGVDVKRHYSHNYLNKIFHQACEKIGLKIQLYEATKHSFGTYHINNGVSKDLLQKWFGHASAKSTEIYARVHVVDAFRHMNDMKKKVVEMADYRTTTAHKAENK